MNETELQSLPIYPHLAEIVEKLRASQSRFLILTAETGAGKSTAVPVALMQNFPGKIVMLEPRRLAVLSVASRIAEILCESVGESVGYKMFLDSKASGRNRIEIITEALLTRQIQADNMLEGVSVVVLDEFHERSIHSDLAFALLQEVLQFRDDLYVLIMSATIDAAEISARLGGAPILSAQGRKFPVKIEYKPDFSTTQAIFALLEHTKSSDFSTTFPQNCAKVSIKTQTILVFLPGIAEIRKIQRELEEDGIGGRAEVLVLHSSISMQEQKKVLRPAEAGLPRVILSSAIAETSLTVPDVAAVIDTGLSRFNCMNSTVGMETLVTRSASRFSAEQRAGRAGRTQAGICWRLWNEHEPRPERAEPEIRRTDITGLLLECYSWGVKNPSALNWLDQPSEGAWKAAESFLCQLEFIDDEGRLTQFGKAAPKLGLHPRLARVALEGLARQALQKAAALVLEISSYKDASPELRQKFLATLERRLNSCKNLVKIEGGGAVSKAELLLAGFPDRLARRQDNSATYQLPSGRMASLREKDSTALPQWLIATEAQAGDTEGRIFAYTEIESALAEKWANLHSQTIVSLSINAQNKVVKQKSVCYGKIILSSANLVPEAEDAKDAIISMARRQGFGWLPSSKRIQSLLLRAEFYNQNSKIPLERSPNKQSLVDNIEEWLAPFITPNQRLTEETIFDALCWHLNAQKIDSSVPEQIKLPNGNRSKVEYIEQEGKIFPVVEIIIQRIFGCFETPRILGHPALLKLLSPARRPLQITQDLEGFWQNTWPEICKEMKGRYPKHNWNYRVAETDGR